MDDGLERRRCGQIGGPNARQFPIVCHVAADVYHGHVAADEVHHVGAGVGRVEDDALRVGANRDAHDVVNLASGGGRVDCRRAIGVQNHAQEPVDPGADDKTFSGALFEGGGDGCGIEEFLGLRLELHALVHINSLARVLVGVEVKYGEETLNVDIEAHRTVGRGADIGQICAVALDDNVLQQVRKGASGESKRGRIN